MSEVELVGVDLEHPALQCAMPLVVEHNGVFRGLGTAFSVLPGLALTASHVVNPERWADHKGSFDGASAAAFQYFEGNVYKWEVDHTYGSRSYDLAFLRFKRPNWFGDGPGQINPRYPLLNLNPPEPGDQVLLFGFPESELKDGILRVSPSECLAKVQSVELDADHPDNPKSYAKLEGKILNGMSGGPCFDKDWNVIGVSIGGWSFLDEVYVALLWSAMRMKIDLFQTGEFNAFELFNKGPAKALGYRRVYVTSDGRSLISKIDPDKLVPLSLIRDPDQLAHTLDFAGSTAAKTLEDAKRLCEAMLNTDVSPDTNGLHKLLRDYFWELDSALRVTLRLAAVHVQIDFEATPDWDELLKEWRDKKPPDKVLDELGALNFSWYSVDLFETRAYAQQCRDGTLHLMRLTDGSRTKALALGACRQGGRGTDLPDGLDRFLTSCKGFVQKLLTLTKKGQYDVGSSSDSHTV